jgi:putative phosphoesterase
MPVVQDFLMKIVIISDIHANFDALSSLPELHYDELWVLGDLVNYGPQPIEVVEFVRSHATLVVSGNHDHAVGFSQDPRCSPPFREMAAEMQKISESLLEVSAKDYLRTLPTSLQVTRNDKTFYLCHAIPSDPLYGYCESGSDRWIQEAAKVESDFLFAGHTHVPFVREIGNCTVMNPGSLGQPKTVGAHASYAVCQDGIVTLHTYVYPIEKTVGKIRALPLTRKVQSDLIAVLETGMVSKIS